MSLLELFPLFVTTLLPSVPLFLAFIQAKCGLGFGRMSKAPGVGFEPTYPRGAPRDLVNEAHPILPRFLIRGRISSAVSDQIAQPRLFLI